MLDTEEILTDVPQVPAAILQFTSLNFIIKLLFLHQLAEYILYDHWSSIHVSDK